MTAPLEPLELLAGIRDAIAEGDTVGVRTDRLADHLGRDKLDVLPELARLKRDGLADCSRDPTGSEWWTVTAGGSAELAQLERHSPHQGSL